MIGLGDAKVAVQDRQIGPFAGRNRRRCRPPSIASAGVVAHIRAASGSDRPMRVTSIRNAASMVRMLPASVPSSSTAVCSPAMIV